ncbi:NADH-quinone oxidoreductase subunit L [Chromobacterium paludis]|uniref:Probable inorganic carbon transporter subunit DabB n=1 Tax=Chromobacterium paludis TaxID=2605945 RepID=A0A5C1DID9_9NEIS|nr:NADH-quinone oxidoreductase subunit L [Chromobacterium paludis]QEL55448.1 NADH-quinone oxidoreductase subunit L [Chromobacterium paludis]
MPFDLLAALPYAIALAWLLPALWPGRALPRHWQAAQIAALAGGLLLFPLILLPTPAPWFAAAWLMQALIQLLGWMALRYSRRYMQGEPGQSRFLRAMGCLLAAVTVVVQASHLALMALGWIACSLALQTLLTFYPGRPAAQLAARREWRASRLAELLLLAALLLWAMAGGSLSLIPGAPSATADGAQGYAMAAGLLLAAAVAIKTAQLPFHGWLTQVMEAPTPISALLHAGVVNLGGMVLIKAAPLMQAAPPANALLLLWGGASALLCCVVMLTRISVKLRLAWSTCAQMGFMLLEIGMGCYSLALLHLLAHSFYKAHAFLLAGQTTRDSAARRLLGADDADSPYAHLARGLLAALLLAASQWLWQRWIPAAALPAVFWLAIGLGMGALLRGWAGWLAALALSQTYLLLHALAAQILPLHGPQPPGWAQALLAAMFLAAFLLQGWLLRHPQGALARRIYPHAFAGFHLDEWWCMLGRRRQRPAAAISLSWPQLQESRRD